MQLLFHQTLEDLREGTKPWSHQTYILVTQLKAEGIEMLSSHLDKQTVVVWMWCQSQTALKNIQRLCDSNQLTEILLGLGNIRPTYSEIIHSIVINIDSNQLKKTVVSCAISVNFTERIDIKKKHEDLCGVTKLRNEIYTISHQISKFQGVIRVFEDRNPFRRLKQIEVKEFGADFDIGSSEKENCLYVSDGRQKCVWKITKETDGKYKIIKWLTTDCYPRALSVSNISHLLIVGNWSSVLSIYGADAELQSIQLPRDIKYPIHAVETSIGNFIILHEWMKKEEERDSGEIGRKKETKWVVSELTRDGQMVIRRFIPSNETEQLNDPMYLSLDSDDRVFVADSGNGRVVLLDSDLQWNRILFPTKKEERIETDFQRIYYDERKKQLLGTGGITHRQ